MTQVAWTLCVYRCHRYSKYILFCLIVISCKLYSLRSHTWVRGRASVFYLRVPLSRLISDATHALCIIRPSVLDAQRTRTHKEISWPYFLSSNFIVHLVKVVDVLPERFYRGIVQGTFRETRLTSGNEESVRRNERRRNPILFHAMARVSFRIKRASRTHQLRRSFSYVAQSAGRCGSLVSQITTRIYLAECTPQGDELIFRDCLCAPRNTWERNNRHGSIVRLFFCHALLSLMKYASSKSLGREGERETEKDRYHHYYRLWITVCRIDDWLPFVHPVQSQLFFAVF